MSAPRKKAAPRPPKGTPTSLNAWTLLQVLEGQDRDRAPGGVITQVEPTQVPAIRRMIAAGWLEPAPGVKNGWRLSELGAAGLVEERDRERAKNIRGVPSFVQGLQERPKYQHLNRGGMSAGMHPRDFDYDALVRGTIHELEHTVSIKLAAEIAMDHLAEDPDYYASNSRPMANPSSTRGPRTIGDQRHPVGFEVTTHFGRRYLVLGPEIGHTPQRPVTPAAEIGRRLLGKIRNASKWSARPGFYTSSAAKISPVHELVGPTDRRDPEDAWVGPFPDRRAAARYWETMPAANGRSRGWVKSAVKRPGKLGGPGFLARSETDQRRILDDCLAQYGTRSCLGSIMLLERLAPAHHRPRLARLHAYVKRAPRSRAIPNPSPTDWTAIPILIVPVDIRGARLTHTQVLELDELDL